jgi:hypothetical protein
LLDRPCQSCPDVAALALDPIEPLPLLRTPHGSNDASANASSTEVSIPPLRFFAGFAQAIERILPYRLQHPITRRSVVLFDADKILVGQGRKEIDRVGPLDSVSAASLLRGRQCPPTGEDRQSTQHRLLGIGEQVVAPVDRRP